MLEAVEYASEQRLHFSGGIGPVTKSKKLLLVGPILSSNLQRITRSGIQSVLVNAIISLQSEG